jgi:hypothetical protein
MAVLDGVYCVTRSMLHAARCTLLAARCTLHAARCTLHAARCKLHAARCTLHAARCALHAARCTLHAARCTLHTARCTLLAACCTLHADGSPDWTALHFRQPQALASPRLPSCSTSCLPASLRSRRRARVCSPRGRAPRTTLNRHYLQFLWVFFLVAGAGVLADGIADVLDLHAYERACFF